MAGLLKGFPLSVRIYEVIAFFNLVLTVNVKQFTFVSSRTLYLECLWTKLCFRPSFNLKAKSFYVADLPKSTVSDWFFQLNAEHQ